MSHFTKCDLRLTNVDAIKLALADMALSYVQADAGQAATVRGYRGQTLAAALSIDMGTYDIGVVRADEGHYELVADWWGVETSHGVTEQEFVAKLRRRYAYHNVKMACEAQGYAVEEETNEQDGSVNLVVRKWVND